MRVLYDWFGCTDGCRTRSGKAKRAGAANRQSPAGRGGEGDHRKVLGVDGAYASVGGICIADGWLERSSETGLIYRDTAVKVRGPAVADLERAFAGTWDLFGAEPLPEDERPVVEETSARWRDGGTRGHPGAGQGARSSHP